MTIDFGHGRWFAIGRPAASLTPAVLDAPLQVVLDIGDDRGVTMAKLLRRGPVWVLRD